MEWFKYSMDQEIYVVIDGEISKHKVRGFYKKQGKEVYVIVTYWRETLVTEDKIFLELRYAKIEAISFFSKKMVELEGEQNKIREIVDIELTEERSPKEIAEEQKKEAEEREYQNAVDTSNSDQEAEAVSNNQ